MTSFRQLVSQSKIDELISGDVVLVESKYSFIDRIIKFVGRSEFTHTAMLVDIKGSWFVVESRPRHQQYEYQMMPADWWVERNKDKDTYIGKMPNKKTDSINAKRELESKIKANVLNPKWSVRPYSLIWCAIVVFLQKCRGVVRPTFKKYDDEAKQPMICSTFIQEAWENAGVIDKGSYMSPGEIAELSRGVKSLTPLIIDAPITNSNDDYIPDNYRVSSMSLMKVS